MIPCQETIGPQYGATEITRGQSTLIVSARSDQGQRFVCGIYSGDIMGTLLVALFGLFSVLMRHYDYWRKPQQKRILFNVYRGFCGAPGRTRTCNLLIRSQMPCPLGYRRRELSEWARMVAGQGLRVKLEFRFHPLYSSRPSEIINPHYISIPQKS